MPRTDPLVLVVEDDAAVRNLMLTTLEARGYAHQSAATARAALASAATSNPDVILLDLGLPDLDGVEVIRQVRSWSQTPIIVISARSEDSDKIDALDAGADDYLTKPFSVGELLARLRTALRHLSYLAQSGEAGPTFTNGELSVDYVAKTASLAGEELHLTPIEFKLLCLLCKNVDKVLTHQYLLREVWGSTQESCLASLRVFMGTLRKKIETDPAHPCYIQTHVGIGYRMMRVS
ncbi:response regulator [Thermophilibacter immobilis]|jgi:two-component system KDP operon response regulator KdpE|uniref:Response regulator n=1 Tax=Thermophilibacter immobilis TaxID=2779519 RepID=A0A7S7M9M9_9ACTN|nr:response regulator [Thermophilibacter immobilis]QOY61314.1 response regulator [Thermophilibacter immobilis]